MEKDELEAVTIIEWLENKLDSKKLWCANSVRTQLTKQMIEDICKNFPILPKPVKMKALLSIFHLPRSRVEEWQASLEQLLKIGVADDEQIIAFLAEILQPYPSTGTLFTDLGNLRNEDNRKMIEKFCSDLSNEMRNAKEVDLLPLECYLADRTVLESILPEQEPPVSHFRLKRKTKAQVHRENLINNASLKRCAKGKSRFSDVLDEIPMRMKMNPRKISTTIPRKVPRCSSHEA